jgi:hypothetical protein
LFDFFTTTDDKFLADVGIGSRKEIKQLLKKKVVTVNGDVVKAVTTFFFNNCLISLRLPIPTSAKNLSKRIVIPLSFKKIAWDINRIDRCLKPCLLRESAEKSSISYYLILNFARNFAAFFPNKLWLLQEALFMAIRS